MGKINEQLDALFVEWKKKYEENGISAFSEDGIMYKREKDINALEDEWQNSSRRILFLLKDQNQHGGYDNRDTRKWLINDEGINMKERFFHNLANLFYGLSHITTDELEQVWYGDLNEEQVVEHFYTAPFAFMEAKKEPGGPNVKNKKIKESMNRDKGFISKEIGILNPNIIVCCGGEQFDFMIKLYGKENLVEYKNIFYLSKTNTIIMYAYHPSYRISPEKHYEDIMHWFRVFLNSEDGKKFLGK